MGGAARVVTAEGDREPCIHRREAERPLFSLFSTFHSVQGPGLPGDVTHS